MSVAISGPSPAHMWVLDDILASAVSEVMYWPTFVSCRLKAIKFKNNAFVGRSLDVNSFLNLGESDRRIL